MEKRGVVIGHEAPKEIKPKYIVFNEDQQEMLDAKLPLMVVAGPGSGKTNTITYKILKHTENVKLYDMMILTFTKQAASELKERLEEHGKIDIDEDLSYIGTFHSVFYKLLTARNSFLKLLEPDEDLEIFYQCLIEKTNSLKHTDIKNAKELNKYFKDHLKVSYTSKDIYNYLNSCINSGLSNTKEIVEKVSNKFSSIDGLYHALGKFYFLKHQENSLSFSDILKDTKERLLTDPSFGKVIKARFKEIYIDEFQDTNKIEFDIVKLISDNNVCAIGDPNQSIYGFLDARISNVKDFIDYYEPNVVQLRYNYRSNKSIVGLTNAITDMFQTKIPGIQPLISKEFTPDHKVKLHSVPDNSQSAHEAIQALLENGEKASDIAVIIRKNIDSRKLEQKLDELEIPYNKISGKTFYELPEIKVSTYMILFLLNDGDLGSFRYLSNQYFGIGDLTTSQMLNEMHDKKLEHINLDTLEQLNLEGMRKTALAHMLEIFDRYRKKDFDVFNIRSLQDDLGIIDRIIENKETEIAKEDVTLNVNTFFSDFMDIESRDKDYISRSLNKRLVANIRKDKHTLKDAVTITSAHTSKGLEWKNVFLLNVSKGEFTENAMDQFKLDDEQVRLLYVAVSRAKENLHLIHQNRMVNGKDKALDAILAKIVAKNPTFIEIVKDKQVMIQKSLLDISEEDFIGR